MTTAPLELLLGPEARELVQAALDGVGGRLRTLRVATVGVRPGGAAVVQYAAEVERSDGRRTREILAATTGSRIPPGAAVLAGEAGGQPVEVGLWRWPQDPALPALNRATDPGRLTRLLRSAGVPRTGPVEVRVRAYRPGRRAVLEVTGGGPRLFLKIVRPGQAETLRHRHELLAGHVPVPPVLASTDDGIVVLSAMGGTPLRTGIRDGEPLPDGPALDALLDRFPCAVAALPARTDHLGRVVHFVDVLACTAVRDAAGRERLDTLAGRLGAAERGDQPVVPVHGDFYEAQLLADGGAITGLLDLDTAGPGHRIDDWAGLLAHLSVLGGPAARRWGAALLGHAERGFAREQLRPRIAAAVLGLATGPFRVQQHGWAAHTAHRLDLADRWLSAG